MSAQRITEAAKQAWLDSGTELSYKEYVAIMKNRGFFWGSDDE
jgi:hypothetical protein